MCLILGGITGSLTSITIKCQTVSPAIDVARKVIMATTKTTHPSFNKQIEMEFIILMNFTLDLINPSSDEFQNLAQNITTEVLTAFPFVQYNIIS